MKKLHEFYTAGTGTAILVGNPTASAINAPQGKRLAAYKDASGNVLVDSQIGTAIGGVGGAALGGAAGALAGPLMLKDYQVRKDAINRLSKEGYSKAQRRAIVKTASRVGGGVAGGVAGMVGGAVIGAGAGALHGHFGKRAQEIRNRHLSANLKPALRELAARSEAIVEFAMVRDASGRYVEVEEDGGMGLGGAIKTGVGAAALGGAGYGAYRADKAIMGKYAPGVVDGMAKSEIAKTTTGFGNMAGNSPEKLASFKAAKVSAPATAASKFAGMGAMGQRKAVYGAAGNAMKSGLLSKVAGLARFLR